MSSNLKEQFHQIRQSRRQRGLSPVPTNTSAVSGPSIQDTNTSYISSNITSIDVNTGTMCHSTYQPPNPMIPNTMHSHNANSTHSVSQPPNPQYTQPTGMYHDPESLKYSSPNENEQNQIFSPRNIV